jgi:hypothetical protein
MPELLALAVGQRRKSVDYDTVAPYVSMLASGVPRATGVDGTPRSLSGLVTARAGSC